MIKSFSATIGKNVSLNVGIAVVSRRKLDVTDDAGQDGNMSGENKFASLDRLFHGPGTEQTWNAM